MINVKTFGAVGDGVADDTAALQRALDSSASEGDSVFFPAGTFVLTSTLTVARKAINIVGESREVTRLKWITGSDGIRFSGTGQDASNLTRFSIRQMTLATSFAGAGTALDLKWEDMPWNYLPKWRIHDIEIRGWEQRQDWNATEYWWKTGIRIRNSGGLDISNVEILGKPGASVTGLKCDCTDPNGVFRQFLSSLHVRYFDVGLDWYGHIEGVYLNNFEIVGCRIGFQALPRDSARGALSWHLTNGHMDCREVCTLFEAVDEVKLSNIMFYHSGKNPARLPGNLVDFRRCDTVTVMGCTLNGWTGSPAMNPIANQNGVVLTETHRGLVISNHITSIKDYAIIFGPGSRKCHSSGNRADNCGGRFLNQGDNGNTDTNPLD